MINYLRELYLNLSPASEPSASTVCIIRHHFDFLVIRTKHHTRTLVSYHYLSVLLEGIHTSYSFATRTHVLEIKMQSVEEFFGCNDESERTLRRGQWAVDDYQLISQHLDLRTKHLCTNINVDIETDELNGDEEFLIPRSIHFIWLGPNPLPRYPSLGDNDKNVALSNDTPSLWNETIQSWQKYHPDWDVKIWNVNSIVNLFGEIDDIPDLLPDLNDLFHQSNKAQNYGMASDIARLLILYQYGGIYVDVDYYCIGSVQEFHRFEFYCGASNTGCIEVNNGLIGSIPRHSFLLRLMEKISIWFRDRRESGHFTCNGDADTKREMQELNCSLSMFSSFLDTDTLTSLKEVACTYTPMEVITHTGPGLLTRLLLEQFRDTDTNDKTLSLLNSKFAVMPSYVFNALPNSHKKLGLDHHESDENVLEILHKFVRTKEAKAVHLWSCSWQH